MNPLDREGHKSARDMIVMIMIVVSLMAQAVIHRSVQLHGAMGISQDTFLADAWKCARYSAGRRA